MPYESWNLNARPSCHALDVFRILATARAQKKSSTIANPGERSFQNRQLQTLRWSQLMRRSRLVDSMTGQVEETELEPPSDPVQTEFDPGLTPV
jgi:hypothetical protein